LTTLDNLRKAAKRWLKALREGDADARARLVRVYPNAPDPATLRDVQHALARERGHASWIALKKAIAETVPPGTQLAALLAAAAGGDATTVAAILDEHSGLVNERGLLTGHTGLRTALHFGVSHEAVVKTLLDRGADPNIRDEGDNAFPIHFAAERGDLPIVKLLIEHGADPIGAATGHELDVLGWAVCFEYATHVEVARYLLAHGARYTPFSAVALGEAGVIRELAQSGVDLNRRMDRTNHRRTALHLAVVKKQPASLAALIDLGADLNLEDAVGLTPLDHAALNGEDEMARLLIDGGASITLPAAIALERTDQIERLVRANPDILGPTNNRQWARLVVHASARASGRVMDTLLRTVMRHRAGLTIVNMEDDAETAVDGAAGYTALHAAAFHGNNEAAGVLLKHGANPRARDRKYCGTPAGWARYARHTATANLILEADVDLFDAIDFDHADRIRQILDRDPGAIDRPFKAYASCGSRAGQWWPEPDCTPLDWATTQQKPNAVRILNERGAGTRTRDDIRRAERIVTFLQSACWDHHVHGKGDHRMHDRAAQRILAQDPSIARDSIYTAIVCGDRQEVERILAARPEAARERGGARSWTPILYLTYTRFTYQPTIENALAIAWLLLDHGADPNDFYMAGDARYTALAGAAGEGEQDSPRQPYAAPLFELLIERGAEPFDIQVLYNTHFSGEVLWWLELVYKHTIHTARAAAWKDPDWSMLDMGGYGSGARFLLETAVKKRDMPLAEWLLARGANPDAPPARDKRFPRRRLYELALMEDLPEMAELLARYGASRSTPAVDEHERFIEACFRLDRDAVRRLLLAHPEYLESPAAMFHAAKRDRPDVLALLLDSGFSLEIQDRTGKRTLHEAAANNALRAARFLVERGAQIDPRESSYNGTPIGWAAHGDRTGMVEFLSRYSRDIWALCFNGYVDRVREILAEEPSRAKAVAEAGITPLWWLPDDEAKAMHIVELLLAAGADPSAKSRDGRTAADWARRRGMRDVAARLETAAGSTLSDRQQR
jgi:ankyrin repeat protein